MKYLLLGFIALFITFCSREDDFTIDGSDYLIFGHFYGECMGEDCVKMFKLTEDKLFEDTADSYIASEFSFVPLSEEKFDQVKELKNAIPDQLLNEDKDTFGCPDCVDQGGLYIEVLDKGIKQNWRIDQDKNKVPAYLHGFMDRVINAIDEL